MYFHISGTSYSFISREETCRHRKTYVAPYYCTQGINKALGGKVCEQQCSNWAACIGYSVVLHLDKCILYPSVATRCPEGWKTEEERREKGRVAKTLLDLVDGGSSGYCKFKQG